MKTALAISRSHKPKDVSQIIISDASLATRSTPRDIRGRGISRYRSNHAWAGGRLALYATPAPELSRFEQLAAKLNLPESAWHASPELRAFARKHATQRYVPEDLLLFWGIEVNESDLGAGGLNHHEARH